MRAPGDESDHVIARQFFPPDERWRGNLPQIPCCRPCNQEKSKVENIVGVIMQFGDASAGARKVLVDRVPRTLARNRPLYDSLREGYLGRVTLRRESGNVVPAVAIQLRDEHLRALDSWYRFVVRGMYAHEVGMPLRSDHEIHLVKPQIRDQYAVLLDTIRKDPTHQSRSLAAGEFRYIYAVSRIEPVSMWMVAFRSVEMAAVTLGPECTPEIRASLRDVAWTAPPEISGASPSQ
jgi:hypothetical protein